jgi:hypothetical protein
MSRPDAVLLNRNNNEIEIMSYKTIGSWDYRKQAEAAHDTQGLSESWAVEGWLQQQWDCVRTNQTANRKRLASTESCSRC